VLRLHSPPKLSNCAHTPLLVLSLPDPSFEFKLLPAFDIQLLLLLQANRAAEGEFFALSALGVVDSAKRSLNAAAALSPPPAPGPTQTPPTPTPTPPRAEAADQAR